MKPVLVLTVVALWALTSCGSSSGGGGPSGTGGTGGLASGSGGALGQGGSSGGNSGKGGNGTGGSSGGTVGTGGNTSGGTGGTSTGGNAGKGGSGGAVVALEDDRRRGGRRQRWIDRRRWRLRRHVERVGREHVVGRVDRNGGHRGRLHAQLQREDMRRRRLRAHLRRVPAVPALWVLTDLRRVLEHDQRRRRCEVPADAHLPGDLRRGVLQRRLDAGRGAQPLGRRRRQLVQLEDRRLQFGRRLELRELQGAVHLADARFVALDQLGPVRPLQRHQARRHADDDPHQRVGRQHGHAEPEHAQLRRRQRHLHLLPDARHVGGGGRRQGLQRARHVVHGRLGHAPGLDVRIGGRRRREVLPARQRARQLAGPAHGHLPGVLPAGHLVRAVLHDEQQHRDQPQPGLHQPDDGLREGRQGGRPDLLRALHVHREPHDLVALPNLECGSPSGPVQRRPIR